MGLSFERLISVTMIGIGILGWLQSRNIKGFAFDALGSQAVPQLLSALLVLAGIWILLQGVIFRGQSAGTTGDTDEPPLEAGDYLRAISMFALSVAFAFLVFQMRLPLSICVLATCLIGGRAACAARPQECDRHFRLCGVDPRIRGRVDLHQLLLRRSSYALVTKWTDF